MLILLFFFCWISMMPAVGVHQLTSCCGTLYCFAWVLFQDDAEAITGTEHISVSTQARTTDVRYLSLPQGPRQPTRQKTRHVTFTGNGSSFFIPLQQWRKLGQLLSGFNSTKWILPWKSLASLNELHPSLLSFLSMLFIWSLLLQFLSHSSTT